MDFSTFGPHLAWDHVLLRGVAGLTAEVTNGATGETLATFDMLEQPNLVITSALGYIAPFKVAGEVPTIDVKIGDITLPLISREAVLSAAVASDESRIAAQASALSAWEAANLVGAPSDSAVATMVAAIGSATRAQLNILYGSVVTTVKAGLMLAADKVRLDGASDRTLTGALATTALPGQMPAADKAKLDAATAAPTANTIPLRDANGTIATAPPTNGVHATTKTYVDGLTAPATASTAGSMPAADKAKLDAATNTIVANAIVRRDANGTVATAPPTNGVHATTKAYVDALIIPWTRVTGKPIYTTRVSITPSAANTPTGLNITYPVGMFATAPTVQVTPYTTVAGTTVTGWGVDGETITGCTVYVTRTNTSGTGINITAIGT